MRPFRFEVLALRYQLDVLERSVKRPKLTASDRFFWVCLAVVFRPSGGLAVRSRSDGIVNLANKLKDWGHEEQSVIPLPAADSRIRRSCLG